MLQEDAFHFSEDFFGKGIGLKGVEGVAEGRREELDSRGGEAAAALGIDVVIDRLAGVELLFDAVETGGEVEGGGEIGIVRHVGRAVLDAVAIKRETHHR